MLFHQGGKIGSLHAHCFGGAGDVPIRLVERFEQKCFFNGCVMGIENRLFGGFKLPERGGDRAMILPNIALQVG